VHGYGYWKVATYLGRGKDWPCILVDIVNFFLHRVNMRGKNISTRKKVTQSPNSGRLSVTLSSTGLGIGLDAMTYTWLGARSIAKLSAWLVPRRSTQAGV
jgi:hypothetical protein